MKKKEVQVQQVKTNFELANERTEKSLKAILAFADAITVENQRNGDLHDRITTNAKQHLQEVFGRFSNSRKLKNIYENIYAITVFPNEQIRFYLLNFYYVGVDLLESAKKKEEPAKEEKTE
jgi:hypothetical protein